MSAPTEAKPATQPICEGCGKTIPEHDALLRCKAEATQQASGERKPYAYAVYFPDQPTEELVHDLDELLDDMTNREHTITELFAALSTPAQQDAVDADWPHVSTIDAVEFRRGAYGLNQGEWASVLGMAQSHYSEFVNGKRDLPKNAMSAAFEYGVPACALFQCKPDKGIDDIRAAISAKKVGAA